MTESPHVLTMHFPTGVTLIFDPDNLTLHVMAEHRNSSQELVVELTEGSIKALTKVFTLGVEEAKERKADRVRQAEEEIQQRRVNGAQAFLVLHTEVEQGTPGLVQQSEFIHRRTCPVAPRMAYEATAQEVKTLVTRYAGNIMHPLDFCAKCFPRDYDNMGPDTFTSPVTDSGELRAVLDKMEAEHVLAAQIASGEKAVTDDAEMEQCLGSPLNPAEQAALNEQLDDSVTLPV